MKSRKNHLSKKKPPQSFKQKKNYQNYAQQPQSSMYEIEKVLDKKFTKGKAFYRIKWKGYDQQKDITWEPASGLPNIAIDQYEDQVKKKQNFNQEQQNSSQSQSSQHFVSTKNLKRTSNNANKKQKLSTVQTEKKMQKSLDQDIENQLKKQIIDNKQIQNKHIMLNHQKCKTFHVEQDQKGQKSLKTFTINKNCSSKISYYSSLIGQSENQNQLQQSQLIESQSYIQKNSNQSQSKQISQNNINKQNKSSPRKLKHLRNNSHQIAMKKAQRKKRKRRKINQFSQDQQQNQTRKKFRIHQQKIPYPDKIQHPYQYPDHQRINLKRNDNDYISYVQNWESNMGQSADFEQKKSISDSQADEDSYYTQRSERGIPQDTLKGATIKNSGDCNQKDFIYQCQMFDKSIVNIRQSNLKRYFPKLIIAQNNKKISQLEQTIKILKAKIKVSCK